MNLIKGTVALLSAAAVIIALVQLQAAYSGLQRLELNVADVPLTIYRNSNKARTPAVVIAHGFAGSRQLMHPFAVTLAQAGYTAVLLDFPGHGQNSSPLQGGLTDRETRAETLARALDTAVAVARAQGDGRVALLGHSMGSEAVVRYGMRDSQIEAVIAISLGYNGASGSQPRNLLVLTGALESSTLLDVAREQVRTAGGEQLERTYGDFAAGTARRAVFVPSVEHIAVLYSPTSMREALEWLDASFLRSTEQPELDARAAWLGLLVVGTTALFWPLASLLQPGQQPHPTPAAITPQRWRMAALLLVPAVLTPLILRPLPVADLLPILIGGYLANHFFVYGLLTLGLAWLLQRRRSAEQITHSDGLTWPQIARVILQGLAIAGYVMLSFGVPLHLYFLNYFPPLQRLPIFGLVLAATLVYFLADEWLTRRVMRAEWAYWLSKLLFLLSIAAAVSLDRRLFFVVLIAPLLLLYFILYGLFSSIVVRRTSSPWPAALANALIFAWTITTVFPLLR